jgi:hypothetical protein
MIVRLHVVVDDESSNVIDDVKTSLGSVAPAFSLSPSRPQPSLANCAEFYGTADMEMNDILEILQKLNNDWDGDEYDCSAYGFNTKMFHPHVYYLQFQIQ